MGQSWDQMPLIAGASGYTQLPYTGWFLLLAWAAGPDRAGRIPGTFNDALPSKLDLTAEDKQGIRDDTNAFLAAAGIPPVPPGYVWFLALPPGVDSGDELWVRLGDLLRADAAARAGGAGQEFVTMRLPVLTDAIASLY